MDSEVEKYMRILYPNYEQEYIEATEKFRRTQALVAENIDAIDEIYNNSIGENDSGTQVLEAIMKKIKSNNYFHMLYPQFDSLTTGEKIAAMEVSAFLDENIDQIDEIFNNAMDDASKRSEAHNTPEEVLQDVITSMKIERFLGILHSGDEAKETDDISLENEKAFIKNHLKEIETQYQILMQKEEDLTENEAIKRTIEDMKERNNDKVNIRNVLQVATQKDGITNEDIVAAERATKVQEKEGVTKDG